MSQVFKIKFGCYCYRTHIWTFLELNNSQQVIVKVKVSYGLSYNVNFQVLG